MTNKTLVTAVLLVATATPAIAQEINGASIEGVYRQYTDDDIDSAVVSIEAGVEVGIASAFAVGGNFAFVDGDDIGEGAANGTLHGIYMYSPSSALGVFAATGTDQNEYATAYGIEIGGTSQVTSFEAYFAFTASDDFETENVIIAGFDFVFEISAEFSLGLDYSSLTIFDGVIVPGATIPDDLTFSDTSLVARYAFAQGASVFAEVGQIRAPATSGGATFVSVNELEYVAIGAEYKFGRGNIFSDRSYVDFGG